MGELRLRPQMGGGVAQYQSVGRAWAELDGGVGLVVAAIKDPVYISK